MDCSTFAFDLHVLGTPPALILSQDQTLMLNALSAFTPTTRAPGIPAKQLFNARPIGSALFNPFVYSWSPPAAFIRTDNSGRPLDATPRADSLVPPSRLRAPAETGFVCACTHYLVFKEPTDAVVPGTPGGS